MKWISKIFLIVFLTKCCISCSNDKKLSDSTIKNSIIETHIANSKDVSRSDSLRIEDLNKAYAVLTTIPSGKEKATFLLDVCVNYYELERFEDFKKITEKALLLAKRIPDSIALARSYNFLGMYYRGVKLDSAYKNLYKADKIYSTLNKNSSSYTYKNAHDHGKVLIDLAKLSRKVKDYTGSEDLTIRAIRKFEESQNLEYLPLCYTNLGNVAKNLEKYDEAVEYYLKSIEYAKKVDKGPLYEIIGNNNIGTVYKSQGDYPKAKEYYQKALLSYQLRKKNPRRYSLLLDNLAYVNFLSNDFTDIPDIFFKTLKIRDSINDKYGIATNSLHLAEYYKYSGNDSLAMVYALKAETTAKEIDYNEELLKSYNLLAEVSSPEEGLQYSKKYIALNDSLIKEERAFRDKFARVRFETAQKEEKIVEISKKNQFLVIITLALTLLSLLGYIIFRQRQRNKELEFSQKQQETNEEIYRLLLTQQTKLEEGRKMEQQRMSEELHDGVLGRLFGVRLSLDGINQRANDGFTDSRNKYIEELKSIEKEIRMISHDLGSDTFSKDIAYVDVVESLINDLCTVHKVRFDFDSNEDINWEAVDDPKKVNLFRIIQESLQNIFKHAKADHVKISFDFDYEINEIKLQIEDNGVGFNKEKVKRGIGLKNITSRVKQMNGNVDFDSVVGEGAKVFVGIPVSDLVIAKKKKPEFSIAPG